MDPNIILIIPAALALVVLGARLQHRYERRQAERATIKRRLAVAR